MNAITLSTLWRRFFIWSVAVFLTALSTLTLTLTACGGGDNEATRNAKAFSSGVVTGLGSVMVNGRVFDETGAIITDDATVEGDVVDLKLGVVVDIIAADFGVDGDGRIEAFEINHGSELIGPIQSIAPSALTVLNQTVVITSTTVFDIGLPEGVGGLAANDTIEVWGFYGGGGNFIATRIALAKPPVLLYKVRASISDVDTRLKTFKIGDLLINYGGIANLPTPQNHRVYRVALYPTKNSIGQWVAYNVRTSTTVADVASNMKNGAVGELEGRLNVYTSATSYVVNGVTVDAYRADPRPNDPALGDRLLVKGTFKNGMLVATSINRLGAFGGANHFSLTGPIKAFNAGNKTFSLRDMTVDYGGELLFVGGDVSDLVEDAVVKVDGPLSAGGTTLSATEIVF